MNEAKDAAIDVRQLLNTIESEKAARAEQFPTEQDCIRMMVQTRIRLLEMGWRSGEYAPKDGTYFEGIFAGFTGPSVCTHLGAGFFIADGNDFWPVPRPLVFRSIAKEQS